MLYLCFLVGGYGLWCGVVHEFLVFYCSGILLFPKLNPCVHIWLLQMLLYMYMCMAHCIYLVQNVLEIQCLANQLQMYYLADEHSKHYKALEMFTRSPDSFQYSMLIDLLKESGMELMQRQQVLQKEEETTDTSTEPPPTN